MGGQQAFQWAVSYPQFMDRVVVTAATAKTYPHGVVRLEGQIATITADPVFKDGDYSESALLYSYLYDSIVFISIFRL